MSARRTVKESQTVGVIASTAALRLAGRIANAPDLFELRLDALVDHLDGAEDFARGARRPLIITARPAAEGGMADLSTTARRRLLERFLPFAAHVDIELRSLPALRDVADRSQSLIVSVHDFGSTPAVERLMVFLRKARASGADIFKIATRTETAGELSRLLQFVSEAGKFPITAMGIGKFGILSRVLFAACGAPLLYGALGDPLMDGQPTETQLRAALRVCLLDS